MATKKKSAKEVKEELKKTPEEKAKERLLDRATGFVVGREAVREIREKGLAGNPRVRNNFHSTIQKAHKKGD